MKISAHDVAAEIRRRMPGVGVVKLHKLLYYAQGWHLAWARTPLFEESVEAWANGPVVSSLWADEKHGRGSPPPRALQEDHLATIDYVLERYGRFSGKELIRKTHLEDPWREVSEADDPFVPANPDISHEAMCGWFQQDDEFRWRVAEVRRLRERDDIYSFALQARSSDLDDAVERAVRGERLRHSRPA